MNGKSLLQFNASHGPGTLAELSGPESGPWHLLARQLQRIIRALWTRAFLRTRFSSIRLLWARRQTHALGETIKHWEWAVFMNLGYHVMSLHGTAAQFWKTLTSQTNWQHKSDISINQYWMFTHLKLNLSMNSKLMHQLTRISAGSCTHDNTMQTLIMNRPLQDELDKSNAKC